MGPIFRHSGAFFMRRSFKGNPLYPVVFRTYLRHVMNEGFPIEFFIEGTRSRTGKLLSPRFGILSWLIEAYLEGNQDDLQFMPISVDYEKLAESRSYVRELSGSDKKKEDVAGLVKSRKMLKSKHGNIYVQVSHPLSLKGLLAERGIEGKQISSEDKRSATQEMAYRILFEINRVSTLTPSALFCFSLLTHRLRGIKQERLIERAQWAADWIKRRGHTRLSKKLDDFKWAMAEAAERFARDGLLNMQDTGFELVYLPVEQRRLALDYYRNTIIHHFVPASIVSLALESFTVDAVPYDALSDRTRDISRLLKFEFLFRSERHFADEVRRALDDLKHEKVVTEENGFVVKVAEQEEKRMLFCAVLEHFIESYWLTARALKILRKGPLHEKDFISSTLRMGDNLFVQGEIRLYESMNREVVKNALKAFEDRKIIDKEPSESRKGPVLSLVKPYDDRDTLKQAAETIKSYLPRQHS
jgi:glycerol-3-phosphate O-acyltransferase